MKTKTLQQTVTFKASPRQTYDMLMDWKKHQSLSSQAAKIGRKIGKNFTAWGSQLWILRPRCELSEALQTEGMAVLNVGLWPLPDMTARDSDVLFRGQSGHPLGLDECLLMTPSRHEVGCNHAVQRAPD